MGLNSAAGPKLHRHPVDTVLTGSAMDRAMTVFMTDCSKGKKGLRMDIVLNHLSEIGSFIAGLIGGSLITIVGHRVRKGGTIIDQSKSRAGGDIVGGNKTSH